ncbi:hypothetical protein WA158_003451 [Blastocystis sp. Blastoise]
MSKLDSVELENILNPQDSSDKMVARWQRKMQQIKSDPIPKEYKKDMKEPIHSENVSSADRFIPNRANMNMDKSGYEFSIDSKKVPQNSSTQLYSETLEDNLSNNSEECQEKSSNILAFKRHAPEPNEAYQSSMKKIYAQRNEQIFRMKRTTRFIPSTPERVLNAPDILDDFYINVLDWGKNNSLAIALGSSIYLWNASSGSISELTTCENGYISSVSWIKDSSNILAIGTSTNVVELWDVIKNKRIRSMDGHSARVNALSWNHHILSSASRDTTIINHDVRIANHISSIYRGHDQEISGLAWSPDGTMLASGGNDNLVNLWDFKIATETESTFQLTDHKSGIKALAWCPFQNKVLATGGGTADRCIKLWNTSNGTLLDSIDTDSQVCALLWNRHEKELCSAHGYQHNQLSIWQYPHLTKIKDLSGHSSRILQLALSPDETTVCSAGADEKLCFWKIFDIDEHSKEKETVSINKNSISSFMSSMR